MEPSDDIVPVDHMDLVGGDLSLDFVNTATGRGPDGPLREKLNAYDDLLRWSARLELLGPERVERLRAAARRAPDEAAAVLDRARALRETIYRVFAAPEPAERDLAMLGEEAGEAAARRRLMKEDDAYAFGWPESDALEQPLWPIALSAAELLTSEDRPRVKECASDSCDWLFLDMSRNRSRRWCDMKECGNRAKARRFYARQKKAERSGGE